jgi:hypothetical protein
VPGIRETRSAQRRGGLTRPSIRPALAGRTRGGVCPVRAASGLGLGGGIRPIRGAGHAHPKPAGTRRQSRNDGFGNQRGSSGMVHAPL